MKKKRSPKARKKKESPESPKGPTSPLSPTSSKKVKSPNVQVLSLDIPWNNPNSNSAFA